MEITKNIFGEVDGQQVDIFVLKNASGMEVRITNYGGIITSLFVTDKMGDSRDVVLGYDTLVEYVDNNPYFGCLVGRYGNRIARGSFFLDGQQITLAKNDGPNHLHGGVKGYDKVVWQATESVTDRGAELHLSHLSLDGDEGYPGNLQLKVVYTLTEKNELIIDYFAETDKKTIVCLTQHSYFNLCATETVLDHEIMIKASNFTPVNEVYIPTGEIKSVAGTNLDFTELTDIGEAITASESSELLEGGYDHNFVLDDGSADLSLSAVLQGKDSGIKMSVKTTEPALQFYSGNFLDGTIAGKGGKVYEKQGGLCLEAQHFPNSPNQQEFPSVTLSPGEEYRQTTVYAFDLIG